MYNIDIKNEGRGYFYMEDNEFEKTETLEVKEEEKEPEKPVDEEKAEEIARAAADVETQMENAAEKLSATEEKLGETAAYAGGAAAPEPEAAGATGEAAFEEATFTEQPDYYRRAEETYEKEREQAREQQYAYAAPSYQRQAEAKHPGYVSKRFFVLFLIIAMLLAMLASVGIGAAFTTYLNNKTVAEGSGHATDYTLSTSDESLSYKSIIKKVQDSVVSIETESVTNDMWMQNYVTQGAGSGVIIQDNGYIITCEHVISGARKIKVTLNNGDEYSAKIVGADAGNDIAVIKVNAKNLQEAEYGDSSKLEVGDQVIAIGNPLGTLSGTATTGIVSALNRNLTIDNRTLNLLQTDASINPGNSGGGMFDASGNLIGIVEAKSTGSDIDGLGFATPINKAAKIAKDIIKTGGDVNEGSGSGKSENRALIGIMVSAVDDATAQQFGYSHGGLLVKSVSSEEAMDAGLRADDIIFKADGKRITSNDELYAILGDKKPGDKIKLTVARSNGKDYDITTKLVSGN